MRTVPDCGSPPFGAERLHDAPSLLAALPAIERQRIIRVAAAVDHPPDALLMDASGGRDCLFITDGLASLHVRVGLHLSGSVGLVGRHGLLGISSLLGVHASRHQGIAVTRVGGLAIAAEQLRGCLADCPTLRASLSGYVSFRFTQALVSSACNLEHGLGPRLADWLALASRMLDAQMIPVTHQRLAVVLGAARPSVTLALQSLEEQKAICSRRGHIEVCNAAVLRSLACGCGTGHRHEPG